MATKLTVIVPDALRRRAKSTASLRGETVSDVVRKALESYVAQTGETLTPVEDLDDLQADFWPEEEDVDELISTVRRWRQEDTRF
jgi:predicted transcriptional regulator